MTISATASASIGCLFQCRQHIAIIWRWAGNCWRRGSVVRTSVYSWRTFPDLCL